MQKPMVESSVDMLTSSDLLPMVEGDASPIFRMFPLEAKVPSRLGAYELLFELASGGMATVFLARRAGLGGFSRFVAIKRLRREVAQAPPFLAMLIDEARLAARIHHPNVAATLEFASEGEDDYYLVMEYVEGGSLLDLIGRAADREEVLPPRVVTRILLDSLAGVHAAHETTDDFGKPLDIVHRDLSPHNLMVALDGCTRVVDFGLARAASRLTKTDVGTLKGKLAYMAPEQLHQRPIDRRADVFSLGVVLWEGLRGQRLFRAETDVATIERVLRGEIPSLRASLPWLSHGVNAVVMKALARDPEARFQTAEELAQALLEAAEATNLLGSRREVGSCVARLLGDDLAQRRERIRHWVATHEPDPQPTVTQLCFAAAAAEREANEDIAADRPSLCVGGSASSGPSPHAAESIAPSVRAAAVPRRGRSYGPLLGGAAIGLLAVGVALAARSGARIPSLADEPAPATFGVEAMVVPPPSRPIERDAIAAAIEARPIEARPIDAQPVDAQPIDARPIDARPIDAQPVDAQPIDAQPALAGEAKTATDESEAKTPSSEIVAVPEPKTPPATARRAPARPAPPRSRPAARPATPKAPVAENAPPAGRDLDNPYR